MILACNCSAGPANNKSAAKQQDEMYGKGNRVHNPMAKEDSFKCTVCGHIRGKGNNQEAVGKKEKKLAKA